MPRESGLYFHCQKRDTTKMHVSNKDYWHHIPAWKGVSSAVFRDPAWQERNCVTSPCELVDKLYLPSEHALDGLLRGMMKSRMSVRLTPHVIALIDWGAVAQGGVHT